MQFEQYRRPANLFFTGLAVLSLTPLSPFSPLTTFTPLLIVMGASMVKELIEDINRGKNDKLENGQVTEVLDRQTGEVRRSDGAAQWQLGQRWPSCKLRPGIRTLNFSTFSRILFSNRSG